MKYDRIRFSSGTSQRVIDDPEIKRLIMDDIAGLDDSHQIPSNIIKLEISPLDKVIYNIAEKTDGVIKVHAT